MGLSGSHKLALGAHVFTWLTLGAPHGGGGASRPAALGSCMSHEEPAVRTAVRGGTRWRKCTIVAGVAGVAPRKLCGIPA